MDEQEERETAEAALGPLPVEINPAGLVYAARLKRTGELHLVAAIHFIRKEVMLTEEDYVIGSGAEAEKFTVPFAEVEFVGIKFAPGVVVPEAETKPLIQLPPGFRHD